jgi:hypothetical protein
MLKKNVLGNASSKSLDEAFRCSECLHFRQHAHSAKEKPCNELGVRGVGLAPKCFTPDITALFTNTDQFVQLAAMFQGTTHKQRRILLGMFRAQKKKQFPIGTKLYFKVGKDFISNYLVAYSAGYTSSGELMLIGSPDRKTRGSRFTSYLTSDEGLLSSTEWKKKREDLRAKGLIFDPSNRIIKKTDVSDQYEPPSIDAVPQDWYDKKDAKKRKKTDPLEFTITQR